MSITESPVARTEKVILIRPTSPRNGAGQPGSAKSEIKDVTNPGVTDTRPKPQPAARAVDQGGLKVAVADNTVGA